MPAFWRIGGSQTENAMASRILHARAESSSEAAALHGHRALTPIIAGAISSGCVAIAWAIALFHILLRRHRRKRRYAKIGQELKAAKEEEERRRATEFILPPDPAVLEGGHEPGERLVLEEKSKWRKGQEKGKRRRRASSASGSGSRRQSKGKERERPSSPRRIRTTPGLSRHSISVNGDSQDALQITNGDVETLELHPHPYHRLSTIISAADLASHRSIPLPVPPKEDSASNRESVKEVDFAAPNGDDVSLVGHDNMDGKGHRYPPSHSR